MVASFGSRRSVLLAIALLIPFPLMNILPFSASVGLTGVMLVCVIVSLRFAIEVFLSRKIIFFGSYSKDFLGVLSFLWLWTVLGALTLPVVFSGFQVVSGAGEHQSLELNITTLLALYGTFIDSTSFTSLYNFFELSSELNS